MNIINRTTIATAITAMLLPIASPALAAVEAGKAGTEKQIGVPPNFLNFEKFNVARECSPAEKYSGKTNCNVCDADTPNITLPYNQQTSRITDAVIVYLYQGSPYLKDKYHNAWNQKTTTSGKVFNLAKTHPSSIWGSTLNGNRDNDMPKNVILHGYNLTGYAWGEKGENAKNDPTSLYPLNMRTKCETFRPKMSYAEAIKKGDNTGFRGAAVLGIGGAISIGAIGAMTNPAGNKGGGMAMGGSSATGGAASAMGGALNDSMARRSFVCLEYHTINNGMIDNGLQQGGQHIVMNTQRASDCAVPLARYYALFTPEGCPYYPCDGVTDGIFEPTTRIQRYLYLLTNPSIMYSTTMTESWRIAYTRPLRGIGF